MLSSCCFKTFDHEGIPQGSHTNLFGLDTYSTGNSESEKVLVLLTDVFGHRYNNTLLVADELAKRSGYYVLVPDILFGDPIDEITPEKIAAWKANHSVEKTQPVVHDFLGKVRANGAKFIGTIGYCFGAKFSVLEATDAGYIDAAACAHASMLTVEDIDAITKPILFSCAEVDNSFPPALRHATESKLQENGIRYQFDLFSGVVHGYAVRGDISQPLVKYAKEKTIVDQVMFFNSI